MAVLHDLGTATDPGAPWQAKSILGDEFLSVVSARDGRALEAEIQRLVSDAGFDRYSVMVIHDDFSSGNSCAVLGELHNAPREYLEAYLNREACHLDPVMQHCKRDSSPLVYGPIAYASADAAEKWERQAPFGYAYGIGTAFHLPRHQHVFSESTGAARSRRGEPNSGSWSPRSTCSGPSSNAPR